jgi:hypothetical protein
MNVEQLIEELKTKDPKAEVILSRDGEGNGHLPLSDVNIGMYDFKEMDLTSLNGEVVVVLYPIG